MTIFDMYSLKFLPGGFYDNFKLPFS